MFFSSDSQNWFLEVFSMRVFEMLPPLAPVAGAAPLPVGRPVAIWVLADTVPVTLRAMFT